MSGETIQPSKSFPVSTFLSGMVGCAYRSTTGDRKLDIEDDYPRAETSREGNEVVRWTEDATDVEMDRIDGSQIESCVGSCCGPRYTSFVKTDC